MAENVAAWRNSNMAAYRAGQRLRPKKENTASRSGEQHQVAKPAWRGEGSKARLFAWNSITFILSTTVISRKDEEIRKWHRRSSIGKRGKIENVAAKVASSYQNRRVILFSSW